MIIRISLDNCLADLEAAETKKPPTQRRHVPTVAELSKAVGITRATLYKMMNGTTRKVSLDILASLLVELQTRGFEVECSDLIKGYKTEAV